jgi:CRISPR-associated endoribonuclease Cas6
MCNDSRYGRGSSHDTIHNIEKTKNFAYSNIFPLSDFKSNESKKLIISSPDNEIINSMCDALDKLITQPIKIGINYFVVENYDLIKMSLNRNNAIETATPIILRLNDEYNNEFWQPKKHKAELFLSQLESNINKKYRKYSNRSEFKFDVRKAFDKVEFKRTVVVHVKKKNKEFTLLGSTWRFEIPSDIEKGNLFVLNHSFDLGFGEMASMGLGFMNKV